MSRSHSFPRSLTLFSSSTNTVGHHPQVSTQSADDRGNTLTSNNHSSFRGMRRLEARRQMEESNFLASQKLQPNLNVIVDLRLLDYLLPLDLNLTCAICRCPFIDPVILTECDHCFCRECIRQTWLAAPTTPTSAGGHYAPVGNRGNCPGCRTPAKLALKSDNGTGTGNGTIKILVNIIDDLLVRCPHSAEGCPAVVKRGEVIDHVRIYCEYTQQAEGMLKSELEVHWSSGCEGRKVDCLLCHKAVLSLDLEMHVKDTCSAVELRCPGTGLGCTDRSKRHEAVAHAKDCIFARLAPVFAAQQQRIDDQEASQRITSRKLEVLESGFEAVRSLLYPEPSVQAEDEDVRADERRIPLLLEDSRTTPRRTRWSARSTEVAATEDGLRMNERLDAFVFPPSSPTSHWRPLASTADELRATGSRATISLPLSISTILPTDFDNSPALPPAATTLPSAYDYDSPLNHLLSLHESLREEFARLSTALQDLDARQSLHTLNENLRMRDEMGFLGAQVAGLRSQVGWLIAAQLQQRGGRGRYGVGGSAGGATGGAEGAERASNGSEGHAGAGQGSDAAAGSAARVVAERSQVRRRASEEGRTKL
ncbi:hypothetical protein LTR35_007079 [Friedmanniomyces endolithicus]|uniref:RING-type domain-containing protein n=1 Tax=Friedmanniomyces endolithicus TaxID=329885 RepID=A0AAN6F9A3_9PEZI|nr:hypothetical protein LTR35_007079 [Friedmanniomyces endolithicus]KAK0307041.1 hypothetical protein LTR82_016082 [Friedmanniomyces endolithicus]KAK1017283.1 hypothetical protein LTR54_002660 [Friedmanniomyces endolithicus]